MKPENRFLISLGWVLFFIGVLIGILFIAGLVWPTLESNFYFGYNGGADTKLKLSCPRIITPQDHAFAIASITNKVDKPINPGVETQISGPILQVLETRPTIEPGQTAHLTWAVGGDNLAYGHLVIVQVYQYASYKTLTAMADCGSLYLFVPLLTGEAVYILIFAASMVLIIIGIALWRLGSGMLTGLGQERFSGMLALAGIVLLGILLGTLTQWILGTLVLAIAVLLFTIQISHRLTPS